jgi:hypothetical protein
VMKKYSIPFNKVCFMFHRFVVLPCINWIYVHDTKNVLVIMNVNSVVHILGIYEPAIF